MGAGETVGLKEYVTAVGWKRLSYGFQHCLYLVWMVAIVIDYGDSTHFALNLKAALHPSHSF